MSKGQRPEHPITDEIVRYLSAHPNAADTVKGITTWWLAREGGIPDVQEVEAALEYLVIKGVLAKRVKADGEAIYGLARRQ